MGSTDSLDSGKDSAVDELSPRRPVVGPPVQAIFLHGHQAFTDGALRRQQRRRRRIATDDDDECRAAGEVPSSVPSIAAREHHSHRSKSADCGGGGGGADADGSRKTHAKSLSVGDDSFDHKIRLWRKRADSQGSIDRPKPMPAAARLHQYTDLKGSGGAPDLVMDLPVRSVPGATAVSVSSSFSSSSSCSSDTELRTTGRGGKDDEGCSAAAAAAVREPDSPDMSTAAERFAKQNQCTLKKYSKPLPPLPSALQQHAANGKPELPPKSGKPPLKAKPQLFKKPVFPASSSPTSCTSSAACQNSDGHESRSQ